MSISAYAWKKRLRVPPPRINDIILERRWGPTADTALRLSRFSNDEQFWLNLQDAYEIGCAKTELWRTNWNRSKPLKGLGGSPLGTRNGRLVSELRFVVTVS